MRTLAFCAPPPGVRLAAERPPSASSAAAELPRRAGGSGLLRRRSGLGAPGEMADLRAGGARHVAGGGAGAAEGPDGLALQPRRLLEASAVALALERLARPPRHRAVWPCLGSSLRPGDDLLLRPRRGRRSGAERQRRSAASAPWARRPSAERAATSALVAPDTSREAAPAPPKGLTSPSRQNVPGGLPYAFVNAGCATAWEVA
ncbi:unnamed protein product [Prorocentrum cordatum]|uniref:Uncharacterized protein n=1 Tax=Prorocentrum cordatum TaxID=2364126 RepID=A0ABN9TGV5_9DINO|nr:unnamed protein product [Polarella glacialis]